MARSWAITIVCVALLVFAPLAFGSVEVWAKTVLQAGAVVLALLFFLPGRGIRRRSRPAAPLAIAGLFIALGLFQLVPLPKGMVGAISPRNVELKAIGSDTAESVSGRGSDSEDSFSFTTLSMYPEATKKNLLLVLTYALVFLSIGYSGLRRPQRLTLYATIICMGFVIALIGLLQSFSGTDKLFWLRTRRYGGSMFGPFVNRNHFAGFANMCMALALGALIGMLAPWRAKRLRSRGEIVDYLAGKEVGLSVLLILALAVMSASVFACASRGGLISLAAGFVFIFATVAARRRHRKSLLIVVPLIALAFGASLVMVDEPAFHRLATVWRVLEIDNEAVAALRPAIWKDTLHIAKDFPVFGAGLGTFCFVFPIYRTFYTPAFCLHAHGDWFEILSETGIIGPLLALALSTVFVIYVAKGMRHCRDPLSWGLMTGGLAAFIAIFAHSFVEFNLHIPSNALYLTTIMGLTIATSRREQGHRILRQAHASRHSLGERSHLDAVRHLVWVVAVLAAAGLWIWQLDRCYQAQRNLERFRVAAGSVGKKGAALERQERGSVDEILVLAEGVTTCSSADAEYHFEVGKKLLFLAAGRQTSSRGTFGPLERLQLLDASYEALQRACQLNPIFGEYHFWMGQSYVAAGLDTAAEKEFDKAAALFPSDVDMHTDIARFYQRIGEPEKAKKHFEAAELYDN